MRQDAGVLGVGYGQACWATWVPVDVVASGHPEKGPAVLLENAAERFPRDRRHTAISRTRSFSPLEGSSMSTERHASTAS